MDDMPKIILTGVVALIILAVGTFAFYTTTQEIGFTREQIEVYNVTNPSITNIFTLQYFPESVTSVYQYNGVGWFIVDPVYWSLSASQVTVLPGGMHG